MIDRKIFKTLKRSNSTPADYNIYYFWTTEYNIQIIEMFTEVQKVPRVQCTPT